MGKKGLWGQSPHLKGVLGGKASQLRLFLCLYSLAANERVRLGWLGLVKG